MDNDEGTYARTGTGTESDRERLDRNWNEILQELRVTQTASQILTGFLLTLAFQPRFADLDSFQVTVYLTLVISAAVATTLALAPVSVHRALFRQRAKEHIVRYSNFILKLTLAMVALILTGTALLIFDVVLDRAAGLIAASATMVLALLTWLIVPLSIRRRNE